MDELLIDKRTLTDPSGCSREFAYSVVIGEMQAGSFLCEDYGVKIQEMGGACAMVPDITISAARIDELISLLIRNAVTPASLRDVIDDWL